MRGVMLITALAAGGMTGCGDDTPRTPEQAAQKALAEAARPAIGVPVPAFTLEGLDQPAFDSAGLRGKTTLLNFWAPWCPPCVQELPELAKVHASIKNKGGQVIGIALARPDDVRTFIADHPMPYPVLLGGKSGNDLARRMGNAHGGLPYSVVIDTQGVIRAAHAGRLTEAEAMKMLSESRM